MTEQDGEEIAKFLSEFEKEEIEREKLSFRLRQINSTAYWILILEQAREEKWDDIKLAKRILEVYNESYDISQKQMEY